MFYEWSSPGSGNTGAGVPPCEAPAGTRRTSATSTRLENYANLGYAGDDSPEPPHGPGDDLLVPALQDTPEPFFLWFHYKFVHLPYWPAEPFRQALGVDDSHVPPRVRESAGTGFVVPRHQFTLEPGDRDVVQRLYAAGRAGDERLAVSGAGDDPARGCRRPDHGGAHR